MATKPRRPGAKSVSVRATKKITYFAAFQREAKKAVVILVCELIRRTPGLGSTHRVWRV